MICEVKVIRLVMGKDMGIIRCSVLDTCIDDDEIVWRRQWLRQITVPRELSDRRFEL